MTSLQSPPCVVEPRCYPKLAAGQSPAGASLGPDVSSFEEMARAQLEIEPAKWEAGLPSEMTLESLRELAVDLRQIEVPDPDQSRLQRAVTLLQAFVEARAEAVGVTVGALDGDHFDRMGRLYQLLVERELVSRATGIPLRSDERKFLQRIDAELHGMVTTEEVSRS